MITRDGLQEVLANLDIEDSAIRWDYSGRHMYGRECFGFVGRMNDLVGFFFYLGMQVADNDFAGTPDSIDTDDAFLLRDTLATDNMGHDLIFYFPGLVIQEPEDDADPDEVGDPDVEHDRAVDRAVGF